MLVWTVAVDPVNQSLLLFGRLVSIPEYEPGKPVGRSVYTSEDRKTRDNCGLSGSKYRVNPSNVGIVPPKPRLNCSVYTAVHRAPLCVEN